MLTPIDGVPSDMSYWSISQAPTGYTLQGRYTWQQNATDAASQGTGTAATGGEPTTVVTSYVDVYTDGPDVLVVAAGPDVGRTGQQRRPGHGRDRRRRSAR